METYTYKCHYCKKEYIPRRRGVQKFCSNSCRTRYHQVKNQLTQTKSKEVGLSQSKTVSETKDEKISITGACNAALGSAALELGKAIFTPEHQKAATKGDLRNLEAKLVQRYHLVKNMNSHPDGRLPYFDLVECKLIYRW